MHSRMRHRVTEFLKVLNRAKAEVPGERERKTVTYVALISLTMKVADLSIYLQWPVFRIEVDGGGYLSFSQSLYCEVDESENRVLFFQVEVNSFHETKRGK